MIIGIAGGCGSGKTYIAQQLAQELGPEISCVIEQSSYQQKCSNTYHPEAVDFDLLLSQLKDLKDGFDVYLPIFDLKDQTRIAKKILQKVKKIIIIEGALLLSEQRIRKHLNLSIFVETPEKVRLDRLAGQCTEAIFYNQIKPVHDQYVAPSKDYADVITKGTEIDSLKKVSSLVLNKVFTENSFPLNPTYQVSQENSLP